MIMQYSEIDGIGPVLFERSKRAKQIVITVTPDKGVRVAVPTKGSLKKAEEFALSKTGWIKKHLLLMEQAEREFQGKSKEIDFPSAKLQLKRKVDNLAARHGFTYNRVSFRNQRTRWGSCSTNNDISLNIKLALLPEDLVDYVILHELVHTQVKNHAPEFWEEVGKYIKQPKQKAAALKKYGMALL